MLSYQTVEPHTLELLKGLMSESLFASTRLVGGTALALQYGHRSSVDLDFFGDAEGQFMPKMFSSDTWEQMKKYILSQVQTYSI